MNCIKQVVTDQYAIYNGDCVEVIAGLPDKSVDYSIFNPPFSSLYTYSNSPRDMGNARNDGEFFEQFQFLIKQIARGCPGPSPTTCASGSHLSGCPGPRHCPSPCHR